MAAGVVGEDGVEAAAGLFGRELRAFEKFLDGGTGFSGVVDEAKVALAEEVFGVLPGAEIRGMPQARASNTRMVGMPCMAPVYCWRGM